ATFMAITSDSILSRFSLQLQKLALDIMLWLRNCGFCWMRLKRRRSRNWYRGGRFRFQNLHEELLDKALFRRFDAIFKYHLPTKDLIVAAFQSRLSIFNTDEVHWQEVAE